VFIGITREQKIVLTMFISVKGRVSRLGACASHNINHSIPLLIKQSKASGG